MRTVLAVLASALMLAAGCTSSDESERALEIDASTMAELQARAFMSACSDVLCSGVAIYAPDSTPEATRSALLQYTDETQYVSPSQIDALYSSEGHFTDGGVLIDVGAVHDTERADVVGLDVWISKGRFDFHGRTYLFRWNGTNWVITSPSAVNVTVTTSVS